jgi:hypothetical protein
MTRDALKMIILGAAVLAAPSFSALPELRVVTLNNAAIRSTQVTKTLGAGNCTATNIFIHKYTAASAITLTDNGKSLLSVSGGGDSIRGRGNSTSATSISKKPYRIKFKEHQALLGAKKHKSWALLANWYDPTFALNAVAFELGRRLGLPGTPGYYFVDLYLNGQYKGIYQITDLVQVNKGRVEVDEKDGWLAELDYHCPSDTDEVDFNTDYPNNPEEAKLHTFIKSPEGLQKSGYQFVKDDINKLTRAMFANQQSNGKPFPENGYRDLIDLESMAKYVMIQMFMDNFDFNNKALGTGTAMVMGGGKVAAPASNFMHKDKGKKIVAGPLWDLDLAAGVDNQKNFPKHYQYADFPIKAKHPFYARFYDDSVYLAKWKKAWDRHKTDFAAMTGVIDSIANLVQGSVEKNFALQNSGGNMTPDAPKTLKAYQDEVGKLKKWWNERMAFYTQEINKLNIDTSKDIPDPASPKPPTTSAAAPRSGKARYGLFAVKNGLRINTAGAASVKVVSLTGNVVRKRTLTAGNHTIGLGGLPRGMYLAQVNLDGVKQTIRITVR